MGFYIRHDTLSYSFGVVPAVRGALLEHAVDVSFAYLDNSQHRGNLDG